MSIISVGTVAFDSIETKYGKRERVVGGAALYTSLAASFLADNIQMVSIVGDDFPDSELEFLKNKNISTEGIEIVEGKKSFFWAGKYHDDMNGRDTLVTELNVLADFDPKLPASYKDSEYLMLGNLAPAIQNAVIEQMNNRPKLIVLDTMNFWMDIALEELKAVIKKVDVLMINDEEARQLSGVFNLVDAAKAILEMGPKTLIIKKGEHGAILFHEEGMFVTPAIPLQRVMDPTGAGDSFAGGFIGQVAKTGDSSFAGLKKAMVMGTVMASFCVGEFSNEVYHQLTDAMVEKRIEEYQTLTHIEL